MFLQHTGHSVPDFDDLYGIAVSLIALLMDPRLTMSMQEVSLRSPRRRAVPNEVMLFIFLHLLRGGNEGGLGLELISCIYGLSCGTISNYIRHVGTALLIVSKSNSEARIGRILTNGNKCMVWYSAFQSA